MIPPQVGVHLVLPRALHETYSGSQRGWLQDVRGFTDLVIARQQRVAQEPGQYPRLV